MRSGCIAIVAAVALVAAGCGGSTRGMPSGEVLSLRSGEAAFAKKQLPFLQDWRAGHKNGFLSQSIQGFTAGVPKGLRPDLQGIALGNSKDGLRWLFVFRDSSAASRFALGLKKVSVRRARSKVLLVVSNLVYLGADVLAARAAMASLRG